MYINIKNENYGYAVATYGDYVVVANPAITRYDPISSSIFCTGSIDYFRYNKSTDEHDYIGTLYKQYIDIDVLLAKEIGSDASYRWPLQTEDTGSVARTNNKGLLIDKNNYTSSLEDGFGLALDMYNKQLIVGTPYYTEVVRTYAIDITASGALVNIYDLSLTEYTSFTPDLSTLIYTFQDPDVNDPNGMGGSFGQAVSINRDWVVIGSPLVSGSNGMVYVYKNQSTGSNYTWSLYQKIENVGSVSTPEFGSSLKLNKYSGSINPSMVIGCGNVYNCQAYFYELISGSWMKTFTFNPDYSLYPMTFADYLPYEANPSNVGNGFGTAVSMYGDAVIVGEKYDRTFHEYSGSSLYQQGSTYIFEKCPSSQYNTPPSTLFKQVLKTYGTATTMKNNHMGFSVDMFGYNAISGVPKTNVNDIISCYIEGTLDQIHQCSSDPDVILNGQTMLIQKNTSSGDWEITNVYQSKKKFLNPYRNYGFDVAIADRSMVIGAPMCLSDSNREINIITTASNTVDFGDVMGKAYIYNLKNLHNQYHVGNVFYRNGKVIIMTSGSVFDSLFFNPVNTINYEYDLQFKGQHTIFEKQIVCTVNPGEFNISTNPTAIVTIPPTLDVNGNGKFDFQDADILLRYMQYKNTSLLGIPVTTDWSSSIVTSDDEISLLNWYQQNYNDPDTGTRTSASIVKWETTDTSMQNTLDLNQDNKIDIRDMNIMWKYFANRLTQTNYNSYITPASQRKLFSDITDYMDSISQRIAKPQINPEFSNYENSVALDKTGSFLTSMATTIGLYSGLDLVAVAKLSNPIKLTPEIPINLVVKLDF